MTDYSDGMRFGGWRGPGIARSSSSRCRQGTHEVPYFETLECLPVDMHAYEEVVVVVQDVKEGGRVIVPAGLVGRVLSKRAFERRGSSDLDVGDTVVLFDVRGQVVISKSCLRLNKKP